MPLAGGCNLQLAQQLMRRFQSTIPRSLAGMLAVLADYAEGAIMQSPHAEVAGRPACQRCGTLHNTGSNRGGETRPVIGIDLR